MNLKSDPMAQFNEQKMLKVEIMFISYIKQCIIGMRKDYHRKKRIEAEREVSLQDLPIEKIDSCICPEISVKDAICQAKDEYLYNAVIALRKRERDIIRKIYIMQETETEVANQFNITQQRVNRLKNKAINKLGNHIVKHAGRMYSCMKITKVEKRPNGVAAENESKVDNEKAATKIDNTYQLDKEADRIIQHIAKKFDIPLL